MIIKCITFFLKVWFDDNCEFFIFLSSTLEEIKIVYDLWCFTTVHEHNLVSW